MREAADANGLLVVSEVMEIAQIEPMLPYVDCFQVGARNMQNFNLLRELGQVRKPILLKRGIAATDRGAAAFQRVHPLRRQLRRDPLRARHPHLRNLHAQHHGHRRDSGLKKLSHLPVVADPSHGTGRRDMVPAMAKAAVAAGADALLIEIHPNADKAVSDAAQTLYLDQFEKLVGELRVIAEAVGRTL